MASPATPLPPVVFEDGLGQRRRVVGARNQVLSVLFLGGELTAAPAFESALRDRITQFSAFQHDAFARARGVVHLSKTPLRLALASEFVEGLRLSEMLALAEQRLIPLEINAAFGVIRQLAPALAALHEHSADMCHGALAPERIIVTDDARVVIAEHVLGPALEHLWFSPQRCWQEFRIPLPPNGSVARFDLRADATQLGVIALALILGRPLRDEEYPSRVPEIVDGVRAVSATGLEQLPAGVHAWLRRALQLDPRRSYSSAIEAQAELDGIYDIDDETARAALKTFVQNCQAALAENDATGDVTVVLPESPRPEVAVTSEEREVTRGSVLRVVEPRIAAPEPTATDGETPDVSSEPAVTNTIAPTPVPEARVTSLEAPMPVPTPVWPMAASEKTASPEPRVASFEPRISTPEPHVTTTEARVTAPEVRTAMPEPRIPYFESRVPSPESRVPGLESPMPGIVAAAARIHQTSTSDGEMAGAAGTFAESDRDASGYTDDGPYSEDAGVSSEAMPRWHRFKVPAIAAMIIAVASVGTFAARRYLATEPMGTLIVNTNPTGVTVVIDGQHRGSTPLTIDMKPGRHMLQIVNDGHVRAIPVTIVEGREVAQFIELPAVAPAANDGSLQVRTEPAGARITIDGQYRGISPLTIEGLEPGPHAVKLDDETSSVTEQVTVEAGATASLVVPLGAPRNVPVSGWITVVAPVDVQIYEDQRLLGSNRSEQIMVAAGRHELEIVNEALGYRVSRVVTVTAGTTAAIKLEWPKGSLALNALPWAEVWVDGERLGETPIGNVVVPIGNHRVVFRHPELGEQAHNVTVTLTAPARISADMRKR